MIAQRESVVPADLLPWHFRIENALVAYVTYLEQMFWPARLAILYPYPKFAPFWPAMGSGVLLTAISIAILLLARKRRYLATGWLWYAGMLIPVIGLVQVGCQSHADRYTYLPQIGLCLLVAWSMRDLAIGWHGSRTVTRVVAAGAILALAACAFRQTDSWRNNFRLWQHAVSVTSFSPIAQVNLDVALGNALPPERAISDFERAITMMPNYAEAHYDLGLSLYKLKRLDEAAAQFQRACEIRPEYADAHAGLGNVWFTQGKLAQAAREYQEAVRIKPDNFEANYNLALVLGRAGRLPETIEQYRRCIKLNPAYADAHGNLARLLASDGELDEAIGEFQRTLELLPNSAQAHFRYGQALQAQRRFAAARDEYQKALTLDPGHLPARLGLAWLLATCPEETIRDGKQAVALAQSAQALAGAASPLLLDALAAAYAQNGQFSNAVETSREALNLNATKNDQPLAAAIQSRLALYEAHRVFLDTNSPLSENP